MTGLRCIAFKILLCLCALSSNLAIAAPLAGPPVVELFTSEGCSSCPAAEAVLTALARREDMVTLGFHVTYWDGLGWRDRFGLEESNARQQRYVRALGLSSAYTPQAIVNGRVDVLGSNRNAIERQVAGLPRPVAISGRVSDSRLSLDLPLLPEQECPCDLFIMGVRPEATTAVGGGENGGRTLRASSIVRAVVSGGSWNGHSEKRDVPRVRFPLDVRSIVALAQRTRDGVVIASGRWPVDAGVGAGATSP